MNLSDTRKVALSTTAGALLFGVVYGPGAASAGTPKCGTSCVPKRQAVETVCKDEEEAEEQSLAAPQSAVAPQVGSYAAPPPVGEVTGESRSWGVRGMSLTLPEVRLELPSLQLPSLVRSRRGPEMQIERSRAPFVTQQAAVYGQMAPGGVPMMAAPQAAPQAAPAAAPQAAPAPKCTPQPDRCTQADRVRRLKQDLDSTRDRLLAIQETLQQELAEAEAASAEAEAEAAAVEELDAPAEETVRPASYGERASRGAVSRRAAPQRVEVEELEEVEEEGLTEDEVAPEDEYAEDEVLVGRRSTRSAPTRAVAKKTSGRRSAADEFDASLRQRAAVNARLARSYPTLADEAEAELELDQRREVARKPSRSSQTSSSRTPVRSGPVDRPQRWVEAEDEYVEEAVVAQTRPATVRKATGAPKLPTRKASR